MLDFILEKRSGLFTLFFIVYLFTLHPVILHQVSLAAEQGIPNLGLGILFLIAPFLELAGYYLKLPVMDYYARTYPRRRASGWQAMAAIFIPMMHIGLAAFLYIAAAQIGGFQPGDEEGFWPQILFLFGFFVTLGKEGLYLGWWFKPAGTRAEPKRFISQLSIQDKSKDALGDLMLLIFSALGYTAVWDFISMKTPVEAGNFGSMLGQYFGMLLFFVLIYVPLRGVYYSFLPSIERSRRQVVFDWLNFAAVAAAALLSVRIG